MKIIAIASKGGHWVEMLRLTKAFGENEVVFISTDERLGKTVDGHKFYHIQDSSRWEKVKVLRTFRAIFRIIADERPDFIISTGAAPGLLGILSGKIMGAKTIWVDSIANVDNLSLSGKLSLHFADKVYTQWPDLANSKVDYAGNILL